MKPTENRCRDNVRRRALIRHTIFKDGKTLHETFRPYTKFGAD